MNDWNGTKKADGKIAFGRPPTAKEELEAVRAEQAGKASLSTAELTKRMKALEKVVEQLLSAK
jgi:hypothetical protein